MSQVEHRRRPKICTIDPDAPCSTCELRGKLHCTRGEKSNTIGFYSVLLLHMFFSIVALGIATYFSGIWWSIPVYVIYWGVYQLYVELIIHCPHCPYWDENSEEIICLPNCGIKKPTWRWIRPYLKHNPKPYSKAEKALLHLFNNFTMFFGLGCLAYAAYHNFHWIMIPAALLLVLVSVRFILFLTRRFCHACANFSCPLNRVPKPTVDAFLTKNPYMGKAWEQCGYRIDSTSSASSLRDQSR